MKKAYSTEANTMVCPGVCVRDSAVAIAVSGTAKIISSCDSVRHAMKRIASAIRL